MKFEQSKIEERFTKYEIARILGARSLQLAMDAPILIKLSDQEKEALNYDTLRIAEKELYAGVLPITVRRPMPKRSEKLVKKLNDSEIKEKLEKETEKKSKVSKIEERKEKIEEIEEKDIKEEGEIMEIANPNDEIVEDEDDDGEEEF